MLHGAIADLMVDKDNPKMGYAALTELFWCEKPGRAVRMIPVV